jgi:uncharacterized integral membrane protein (TIGR00697 family)
MGLMVVHMPADPRNSQELQPALALVFGRTWRVVLASILAYWAGDFSNSYVMAKMKILTRGRWLWSRTIGSTVVGQAVDSAIFLPLAFLGVWPMDALVRVIVFTCIFKICVEVVLTPLTYLVVNWLKRVEREDYYDYQTNFTPFSLQD